MDLIGRMAQLTHYKTNEPMKKRKKRKELPDDDFDDKKLKRFIEDNFEDANGAAMPIGFANAFVGVCYDERSRPVLVYDIGACVKILMERDEMSLEEAQEFFDFNVAGSKFSDESHPLFINYLPREAWAEKRKPGKR